MEPPEPTTAAPTASRRWWPAAAITAFVLGMVAARWDPATGFTGLLRFGEHFADRRLAVLDGRPLPTFPAAGYDGQFYAQLAVAGNPATPELGTALDNVRYRARRIFLPAVAHVLGAGHPLLTLNVYALLNVVAWLVLAWRLWRLAGPLGAPGPWVWGATMLGIGVLDSVRLSLTDLPALVLFVVAVELAAAGRRGPALAFLAIGGLTRELTLLAAPALPVAARSPGRAWLARLRAFALAALPLALWLWWLHRHVAAGDDTGTGNFSWPGAALAGHVATCARQLADGNFDGRHLFGLLAAGSFIYQSWFIARRWRDPSPWVRAALPFAALVWFLGDQVWHGYWAAARTLLPLTLAFNLSLPRDSAFGWRLLAGNILVLHGVWRLLPD